MASRPESEFVYHAYPRAAEKITSFPEVVEFYTIGGEHDFMIKVIVRDMVSYRRFFVEQLGEVPNIAKLQSIIVLDTIKRESRIPL